MRRLRKAELLEDIEDVEFSRSIAYNTVKYKRTGNDKIYIRFYDTDIIILDTHDITLNSGGYQTITTKNRINKFQNICRIQQIRNQWYVSTSRKTVLFYDNIKISTYKEILYPTK